MNWDTILLRYGEIFLKGKNQKLFENKLVVNMQKIASVGTIHKLRGRLLVEHFADHHLLKRVFGLVSYSPAIKVEKNLDAIKKTALEMAQGRTFCVKTKRSDKSFPIISPECNKIIGEYIEKNSNSCFSFKNPEVTLHIEINQLAAFVFTEVISCFGGLPTGIEGNVDVIIDNEQGLLAALQFMRRGCSVQAICVGGQDVSMLEEFSPQPIVVRNITSLEKLGTMQNAGIVVVSGETFADLSSLNFLKPLIAYSKEQVQEELSSFRSILKP
jgi:tRNA uracil 4-sulfurtransferase